MSIYTKTPTKETKYDPTPIYYVYMYIRDNDSVRGCKGSPYYIGKGKNRRAYKRTYNTIKPNKQQTNIRFIIENVSEEEALMWEEFWIDYFGRIDLGTGCLHNKTKGGDGITGAIRTEQWNKNVSKAKKGKIPKKRSKESYAQQGLKCKGSKLSIKICPHCKLCGAGGAMNRFHFNNCKKKTI